MSFITVFIGTYLCIGSLIIGYLWNLSNDNQKQTLVPYASIIWLLWCLYLETTWGLLAGILMRVLTHMYYADWIGRRGIHRT